MELPHFDVAVCGAGPAGMAASCYLAKAGFKVALCEQATFPRHQIGESLLPFSWRIFQEIGFDKKLESLGFVKKHGATFHSQKSHAYRRFFFEDSLNAEFPHIYHVGRDVFDAALLEHVKSLGVTVFNPYRVDAIHKTAACVKLDDTLTADLLLTASGIGNASRHTDLYVPNDDADNRSALYSYFLYDSKAKGYLNGDILIDLFYDEQFASVFPDDHKNTIPNWAWAIPISDKVMSVGYVMHTKSFAFLRKKTASLETIGQLLLDSLPAVADVVDPESQLEEYRLKFNFQRVCRQIVFDREIFIGDAAGFIDPVFSSGVHIGLNSARLAAETIIPLKGSSYSKESLESFANGYHKLFWTYYRFVKMFYEKNLVENLFLKMPSEDAETQFLARQFTSILSGDIQTPNPLVSQLYTSRLNINPKVADVFA